MRFSSSRDGRLLWGNAPRTGPFRRRGTRGSLDGQATSGSPRGAGPAGGTAERYRGGVAEETATHFEELAPLDAFFLYAERDEAPLHIGAVYIFEGEPSVAGGRGARGIVQTL